MVAKSPDGPGLWSENVDALASPQVCPTYFFSCLESTHK